MRKYLLTATAALLPVLMGFTGCEEKPQAPEIAPESGAVIKVVPDPANENREYVTVRWPSGEETKPRLSRGLCTVKPPHNTYPKCADRK